MAIEVGERMPKGRFDTVTTEGVRSVTTDEIFAGRRVVLFAVPGAFAPTCSDTHLPGFLARADDIKARGIDTIACLAVNDVFVMEAWRKATGVGTHLLMLADGSGEYTRALGLVLDGSSFGMGMRSKRFAAVVDDGVVQVLNVESGPGVDLSSAETILAALGAPKSRN
jgi:peroxiredoxin